MAKKMPYKIVHEKAFFTKNTYPASRDYVRVMGTFLRETRTVVVSLDERSHYPYIRYLDVATARELADHIHLVCDELEGEAK